MSIEYEPCSILITGGSGFIGSHVVEHFLKKYQYIIVNVDILDYPSLVDENHNTYENYFFYKTDIRNTSEVSEIIKKHKIDTVMHFAAYTHVDLSFQNPDIFIDININGTQKLLQVAKENDIKRFVHVSTDEVYGDNKTNTTKTENEMLNPTNPYSASKAGAEHMVHAHYHSFNLPVIVTRGNNVYGPRQFPEKLVPKMICRAFLGMDCCIHGMGECKRSFLFVEDVAKAFDVILHRGKVGETYNIGNTEERKVVDIVKDVIRLMGKEKEAKIYHTNDRFYNDSSYLIDSEKIHKLGWKPKINFEDGLKRTIDWYIENECLWTKNNIGWKQNAITEALKPHPNPQIRNKT
jgi:dTDP-glucose 4,6-dehydratase